MFIEINVMSDCSYKRVPEAIRENQRLDKRVTCKSFLSLFFTHIALSEFEQSYTCYVEGFFFFRFLRDMFKNLL